MVRRNKIKAIVLIAAAVSIFCMACGSSGNSSTQSEQSSADVSAEETAGISDNTGSTDSILLNDYIVVICKGMEGDDGYVNIYIDEDAFSEAISSMGWDEDAVTEYYEEMDYTGDELTSAVEKFTRSRGSDDLFSCLQMMMTLNVPDRIYNGTGISLSFSYNDDASGDVQYGDYDEWLEIKETADLLISLLAGDFTYEDETITVSGLLDISGSVKYSTADEEDKPGLESLYLENMSYVFSDGGELCLYFDGDLINPNEDWSVSSENICADVIMDDGTYFVFEGYVTGAVPAGDSVNICGTLTLAEGDETSFDAERIERVLWYVNTSSRAYYDTEIFIPGDDDFEISCTVAEDGTFSGTITPAFDALENAALSEFSSISYADHVLCVRMSVSFWNDGELLICMEDDLSLTIDCGDSDWGSAEFTIDASELADLDYNEFEITALAVSENWKYETDAGVTVTKTETIYE